VNGKNKVGYTNKTREVGFNGIVDITWGGEPMMTPDKSSVGEHFAVTQGPLRRTASLLIMIVDVNSAKHYCIGPMILGLCENNDLRPILFFGDWPQTRITAISSWFN
jgi:hypothetical protein